eukprot:1032473-Pleurochrysis_carterae.AAC.1
MPKRWAPYVDKHNRLARFTAALVTAARRAEVPWAMENPADCGNSGGPAWWPRMADHAPIWLMPCIRDALLDAGADAVTFAQCALGAKARKYTTVAHAPSLATYASGACGRRSACTGRGRTQRSPTAATGRGGRWRRSRQRTPRA